VARATKGKGTKGGDMGARVGYMGWGGRGADGVGRGVGGDIVV